MCSKNKAIKIKIEDLRKEIVGYNYLYYVKDEPEVSDSYYDNLFRELQELEDKYPEYYNSTSPTQTVGYTPYKSNEVDDEKA